MISASPANSDIQLPGPAVPGIPAGDMGELFGEVSRLAAQLCGTVFGFVVLLENKHLWFGARDESISSFAPPDWLVRDVAGNPQRVLIIPDLAADTRFRDAPLVRESPAIRFLACAPLVAGNGHALGALCVMDRNPRTLSSAEETALRILAHRGVSHLELQQEVALLRRETEQLSLRSQALNASSDSFVIVDARLPDMPIIMVNPSFERITGYSAAEVLGKNCRFLQREDRNQPGLQVLRNAIRLQRPCRVILRNYRKDGRPFWNELHVSPVRDQTGQLTHYIGVQSDITARKESEDAMIQRDAILEGVSNAAETLLNAADYRESMPDVLSQIGQATAADILLLWRTEHPGDGVPLLRLSNSWSDDQALLAQFSALCGTIEWDESTGWVSASQLRAGRAVQGAPESCTPVERKLLESLGIKSFLFLPVLTGQGGLWGVLIVGCRHEARRWGFVEIEALRSATRMIGAVLHDRATAAALQASDQRFRTLVTNLTEAVFQIDVGGCWTFLNPAWTQILGYGIDESIGTNFLGYAHPEDRDICTQSFSTLLERKTAFCRLEIRTLHKSGGIRWVEIYASLLLDNTGLPVGLTGTLTDVTERHLATETLRKQRAAIEAAIDGVALLDNAGLLTYLNDTFLAMFGYAQQADLVGKSWHGLYRAEDNVRISSEALPAIRQHGRWRGFATALRRNGSTFAAELSLTQVEGGGIACVCRDITDQRQAEEHMQGSLREKEVMLKEIHHRVKNNMQIVSSLLNLQLEHLRDEEARTQFMESQNRIASMALVHEKLYQSSDLARIDFTDYMHDLTDNLVGAVGSEARQVVFELHCDNLLLTIDTAIPCGLIINELVSNCYKHGFPDGRSGRVSLSFTRIPDGRLRLDVADTGVGLPAGFDIRQIRSLGMQLVSTLVQQLRGTIEFSSDGGAHFIIHLCEAVRKVPLKP